MIEDNDPILHKQWLTHPTTALLRREIAENRLELMDRLAGKALNTAASDDEVRLIAIQLAIFRKIEERINTNGWN